MLVPSWVIDLIKESPTVGPVVLGLFFGYRAIDRLISSPRSIATIFGVLGGEKRRKDAIQILDTLCSTEQQSPASPPAQRRLRRRRRKRS